MRKRIEKMERGNIKFSRIEENILSQIQEAQWVPNGINLIRNPHLDIVMKLHYPPNK